MAFPENNVVLSGNLTRDPEQKGNGPVNLSLANNQRRKDKHTGEYVDDPSFFDVVVWERELAAGLSKGESITVAGRLRQERWEDQTTGQKRSKVVIVANTVAKTIKKPKGEPEIDW